MEQIITPIILIIFVMFGVMYIIQAITMLIMKPPAEYDYSLIIPISGHHEDIEYLTRSISERSSWCSKTGFNIILLNCGADEETLELCRTICNHDENIVLLDTNNIASYFSI